MNLFEKLGTQKNVLTLCKNLQEFVKDFSICAAKAINVKDFKTEEMLLRFSPARKLLSSPAIYQTKLLFELRTNFISLSGN